MFLPIKKLVFFLPLVLVLSVQPPKPVSEGLVLASSSSSIAKGSAMSCFLSPVYESAFNQNWSSMKVRLPELIDSSFTRGDSYVIYNVQTYTNNLLDMAIKCKRYDLISELSGIYLKAYPYLLNYTVVNGQKVYYSDGHYEWHCTSPSCVNWATNPYKENIIPSSQFIYLLSRTLNAIAATPAASRTSTMIDFAKKYNNIIHKSHLYRWIWATKNFKAMCGDATLRNHLEHMRKLVTSSFPNTYSYCNAVRDQDLWILAAAVEYAHANALDPVLVPMSASVKGSYKTYITVGIDVVKLGGTHFKQVGQRTNYNGSLINVIVFDPGKWRDHPDYAYAGYSGSSTPTTANKAKGPTTLGWDVSHFRRWVHVAQTLYEKKSFTGSAFPSDGFMKAMSYQIAYVTFNGNFSRPLMTNFMDGTNGWYRVGYSGSSGIPPYGLSKSLLTSGYGFWANLNGDLAAYIASMYERVTTISPTDPDFALYGMTTNLDTSYDMLMTLPSLMYVTPEMSRY